MLYTDNIELKQFIIDNMEILETVFIVSQLVLSEISDDSFVAGEEFKEIKIKVEHADGEKCVRCWKYSDEIGSDEIHKDVCPRCGEVLR